MIYCFFIIHNVVNNHIFFFFFNDTATTEIYTLSLHDALPIFEVLRRSDGAPLEVVQVAHAAGCKLPDGPVADRVTATGEDRKSTRLNSSHLVISYAVFCLKKKNTLKIYSSTPTCYRTAA